MKTILLIVLAIFANLNLPFEEIPISKNDAIEVKIFMHEDCRICQFYTLKLKELHKKFASDHVIFQGIFPAKDTEDVNLAKFKDAYKLPFELINDSEQSITKKFEATITPEVIVYNKSKNKIIYKGRIDDSYFKVGRRRTVNRTDELAKVLNALKKNKKITVTNQPAVGCYISLSK